MQNLLLTGLLACSLTVQARNEEPKITPGVVQSFNQQFKTAKEVQWKQVDEFYRASFWKSDQYVEAYFTGTGNLFATTRKISPLKLPVILQVPLRQYADYWITDATELFVEDTVSYVVTLQSANDTLMLRSSGTQWKPADTRTKRQRLESLLMQ